MWGGGGGGGGGGAGGEGGGGEGGRGRAWGVLRAGRPPRVAPGPPAAAEREASGGLPAPPRPAPLAGVLLGHPPGRAAHQSAPVMGASGFP